MYDISAVGYYLDSNGMYMLICYIAQVLQAQLQGGLLLIIIHIARVIAGIVTLYNILVKGLNLLLN